MMSTLLWALLSLNVALGARDCLDPAELDADARQAILEGRMDDATLAVDTAVLAFACQKEVSEEVLSNLWLTEGVRLYLLQDIAGAKSAFASSARLHPVPWPEIFGPDLEVVYGEAVAAGWAEAELLIRDLPKRGVSLVDGQAVELPQHLPEGLYLIQIQSGRRVVDTHLIQLPPNEVVEVVVLPPEEWPTDDRKSRRRLVVGGSVSAVAAGVSYGLARGLSDDIATAPSEAALSRVYRNQKLLAGATYGLAGVSAIGFGLSFAL